MRTAHGSRNNARTTTETGGRRWLGALAVVALCLPFIAVPAAMAETPGPVFSVQPDYNAVWLEGWEPRSDLSITIHDDNGSGEPGPVWQGPISTATDGDGNASVTFEADGPVDFPGRHFQITGTPSGGTTTVTKTHVPTLTLDMDPDTAIVNGTTDLPDFQGLTIVFWSADHVTDTVSDGGTVSSGDGTVDEGDPVETTVTAPTGTSGQVTITETTATGEVTGGFALLGSKVTVTGPSLADGSDPYLLTLLVDESIAPADISTIDVLRDGAVVDDCTVPASYPCVASRTRDAATGDVTVTIHTLEFSTWALGVRAFATIALLTGPTDPVAVGTPVAVTGYFEDTLPAATHTVSWDWGDDTTEFGGLTATHTYTDAGIYSVTMTVTADDGHMETQSYEYVVVYDPDGGFVTGGGWIDSPAGAFAADENLSGKATFGFVAKYRKGADVPDGSTEFRFHAAGLEFHSTSYDWLVVAGKTHAKFKGDGTVNGTDGYQFMLTAVDGEPDTFRIKIWEESTGDVVYDNGLVDAAGTPLGGGSVVVHTKGR